MLTFTLIGVLAAACFYCIATHLFCCELDRRAIARATAQLRTARLALQHAMSQQTDSRTGRRN